MNYLDRALGVMAETMLQCSATEMTPSETAKAIDAAYPFGVRAHWPYKAWLEERRCFFAAHGLPRKGDYRQQMARGGDLVAAMARPGETVCCDDGRQP